MDISPFTVHSMMPILGGLEVDASILFQVILFMVLVFYTSIQLWWSDAPTRCKILIRRHVLRNKNAPRLPPGSFGLPFIGGLKYVMLRNSDDWVVALKRSLLDKHGEICLFAAPPHMERGIMLSGPEATKWAFGKEYSGLLGNGSSFRELHKIVGEGALSIQDNDMHKKLRSGLIHLFQPEYLRGYAMTIDRITRDFFNAHWSLPDGSIAEANVFSDNLRMFTQGYFEIFFGLDLKKDTAVVEKVEKLMPVYQHGVFMPASSAAFARSLEARVELENIFLDIIHKRRILPTQTKRDMITVFIERDDIDLTDKEIFDNMLLFVGVGPHTVANNLTWVVHHINQNPEVLDRLRAEHLALRKSKANKNDPLTFDETEKLLYTDRVILETMRFTNPTIPFMRRRAGKDLVYKGYIIPKGYKVYIDVKTMATDPANFPDDPLVFKPDRHKGKERAFFSRPDFKPFLGGPKMCIAYRLAMFHMKIVLHYMITDYTWALAPEATNRISYYPYGKIVDGIPLRVKRRLREQCI